MKPLESYRQSLIWLYVHPADESSTNRQKLIYVAFAVAILTSEFVLLFGSLAFCWKFFSIDLERCMLALMCAGTSIGCIYMMIISITTKRQKIAAIFEDLTTIYNTYENEEAFRFLVQANNICEWMVPIYLKYVIGAVVSVVLACVISAIYCWLMNEHLDVKDCFHIAPIVMPWNQTTLLGYFFEVAIMVPLCTSYLIVMGAFLLLFISMSIHHHAFYKMFKHSIDKLNQSKKKCCDVKFLCDLIRFQISVKDWFLNTGQFYSPVVMVQIICNGGILAVSTFDLDLQFQYLDFDVIPAVLAFSFGISNALLYCYFGKISTESYEKMRDCLFDLKWYELPIATQKYFILMAANMQRPLRYHGFTVLDLNLETFTRMLRSVFSYYTAIKTITSK